MNILILYLDITVAKIYNYGNDVNSLGREFSLRYYCCLFYHFSMKFSILVADKKYICRMVWRNLLIIGGEEKFQKGVKGGETWRFIVIIIMTMFMGDKNRNID